MAVAEQKRFCGIMPGMQEGEALGERATRAPLRSELNVLLQPTKLIPRALSRKIILPFLAVLISHTCCALENVSGKRKSAVYNWGRTNRCFRSA